MLEHLRKSHPDICRAWFNLIDVLGMASGTLNLRAHSNIHRDYLKRTSAEAFNDAARTVSGRLISVRFLGPDESWTESSAASTWPAPIEPEAPRPAEGEGPSFGSATEPGTDLDPYAPVGGVPLTEPPAGESAIPSSAPEATTPQPAQPLLEATPQDRPALTRESPASRVVIETRERRDDALVINPDYNFENFVVGPGNRLAHAAGLAVGENQGRQYNPLFIHGGVGLGKTHLLQAACLRILDHNPAARVYYVSCEGFMTQFMESVQSGKMAEFRHRYRDVDVLVVDDIHFLAKRNRTQEEFFHTFNTLYQAGKQILLSSDAAPEEIPDLEERLVSRFKWGLVAKIDPPCYETRVAILKTKAKVRGMTLPDDCACFIAARIDTNIRELEGAITRLQILASVEGRPIDLDLARTSLGGLSLESPPEPSIQQIITAVTDYFHIRLSDLQSKKRPRSVTLPRQICMYFARKLTRLSLGEIGGYFGGRDHTTVMHAVKAVETREEVEPDFAPTLRAIEEKIRAAA
jgi:chromosomal replication initiator protein